MRTADEIRADIERQSALCDNGIAVLEDERAELMKKVKAVTKQIGSDKRAKASAIRKLHLELGQALAQS